jgi:hypothetical protein
MTTIATAHGRTPVGFFIAARGFALLTACGSAISLTRRARSPQREGAAGFPSVRRNPIRPLPRVAVGISPLRVPKKRRIPDRPFTRVQIDSMDGPANLSKFSSPKRPLRGAWWLRFATLRRSAVAVHRPERSHSIQSGQCPLKSFFLGPMQSAAPCDSTHARCRSSRTEAGDLQPPGMGMGNRGKFTRSRAPWSGIAVLRADTPARNIPVLGHGSLYIAADVGPGHSVVRHVNDGATGTLAITAHGGHQPC